MLAAFYPLLTLILLLWPAVATADSERSGYSLGPDRFVAGIDALVRAPVPGDLFAAGGEVDALAEVRGDAVLAGGRVRLDAPVGEDVYAAGGRVAIDAPVAGNARVAGGSVQIGPRARIAGNASLAGGRVSVLGPVEGYLQVAAGRVYIDAPIGGDAEITAEDVELGPRAAIAGELRRREPERPFRDFERFERTGRDMAEGAYWAWTLGLMVLGAVLAAAFPDASAGIALSARRRFGWSSLAGFIALIVIPFGLVVLAATVVGIPLALLGVLGYLALLLVGFVASGFALGHAGLARWARTPGRGSRAAAAAVGVLVVALLVRIPFAGALVALLALIVGVGAILLQFRR